MPLILEGRCHYHPGRAGIGICVECRQVVCAECSTQFEGINRCATCLARMGRRLEDAKPQSDWRVGSLLGVAGVFLLLWAIMAIGATVVAP